MFISWDDLTLTETSQVLPTLFVLNEVKPDCSSGKLFVTSFLLVVCASRGKLGKLIWMVSSAISDTIPANFPDSMKLETKIS